MLCLPLLELELDFMAVPLPQPPVYSRHVSSEFWEIPVNQKLLDVVIEEIGKIWPLENRRPFHSRKVSLWHVVDDDTVKRRQVRKRSQWLLKIKSGGQSHAPVPISTFKCSALSNSPSLPHRRRNVYRLFRGKGRDRNMRPAERSKIQ